MKKIKKMKERILSIVLTLVMVLSLFAGMTPAEVHAEGGATLTYEVVGGSGTMNSVQLTAGESFTLPNPSFTPDSNREFYGWMVSIKSGETWEVLESGYTDLDFYVNSDREYKATAYYGYRVSVINQPESASIMSGSTAFMGNPNIVVVPEFEGQGAMEEGNLFAFSDTSMESAPTLDVVNATAVYVDSSDGIYMYIIRSITGPVTVNFPAEEGGGVNPTPDPEPTAPIIIKKQPESATVNVGERATFTVEAESTTGSTLSYQWQVDYGSGNGFQRTYENGEKTATLTTYSVDASYDGYKYRCVITDTNGNSVTSDEATVTVNVQRPTQVTGVSISKTADGYKVTGLGDTGEGNRWAYCPYKLRDGENLDEAIAELLNSHLTEGPWESELANSFDESFEITTYTSPNTGVPESLDNYDYIEIVKLDADWMIREVAVLALPKTAAEPAGTIASLENCVSVNGKTVSFNLDPNKEYVIGILTSEELGLPGSMFNGTCQESYNMLMNGIGMPVLPKSEFTTAKIKEYLTNPLGVGPIMANATTGLVSSHDPITVTDGVLISIGEVRSEDKIEYVDDQYSERNGDYYITYGVYAVFIPAAETGGEPSGDIFIDSFEVEVDWENVPALEKDSREIPELDEIPATTTDDRFALCDALWGVKLDESFLITEEDAYYEEALEEYGEDTIEDFNEMVELYMTVYGWGPLEAVLSNPYYTINENDVYVLFLGLEAADGYIFGSEAGEVYAGEVITNVTVGCQIIDGSDGKMLALGLELGTLADMEEERNPEVTYDITLDRTNYADGYVELYTYASDGSNVEVTQTNNATIQMPSDGFVRVFADSEFTVVAEGATISEMMNAGDEGYYYELTNVAADTTVVVSPKQDTPVVTAPVITGQPQNASAQEGATATFTVTATGENVTYQWQIDRNDGNGFVNLNGATSASYTTSVVDLDCDGFKYQCIITNEGGSVTTTPVTLTVTAAPVVHTHAMTPVAAVAATCTEDGNTAYYKCTSCGNLYADANGTTATTLAEVKVAKLGHDWSGEWTVTKEATATEEGKKETLCVRGCGQKKVVAIPVIGSSVDNSGIEKDAEVTPDAPIGAVTLNNTTEELLAAANIFNETERQQIAAGVDARVWLEVSCTDESTISEAERASVEQLAATIMGENLNITYFEADLFKQVGNGDATPVPEPGVEIEITIAIPAELLNADGTVTREYKIIRLHENEEPIVISGTFNAETGEFTFVTNKFSTYAIVYSDTPVNGGENTPGTENNPTPDNNTTPNDTVVTPNENVKDSVPKTGDSNMTLYAFVLMLLSGAGILFSSKRKEEYSK